MNTIFEPIDSGMIAETRNTYSARLLTDPQFEEFVSICTILNREIHRSGSFIEKLNIYTFAVSLTEKGISTNRAESIIRDLFKALFNKTLDQLRQSLLKAEEELDEESIAIGFPYAIEVLKMIEGKDQNGRNIPPIPFHRAYAHQATLMATQLFISDVAAKKIISKQFEMLEERDFYQECKEYEARFYQGKIRTKQCQLDAFTKNNSSSELA